MSEKFFSAEDLAMRFRQLRRDKDLTQAEFAEKIGLKQSNYASFESGRSNITISALAATVVVFEVDIYWLMFGNYRSIVPNTYPLSETQKNMLRIAKQSGRITDALKKMGENK